MPDVISDEDKAAIKSFTGKIQYIPAGVSAFEPGEFGPPRINRKQLPAVLRARQSRIRAEYRGWVDAGMTIPEIAKESGRTEQTVYGVLRRMRLKARAVAPRPQAVRALYQHCVDEGLSIAQIAVKLARDQSSVRSMVKRMGLLEQAKPRASENPGLA